MKHKLLALSAVALLFLSGCASAATPQETVTVTAKPAPQQTTESKQESSDLSVDDEFDLYLLIGGVPGWMIDDRDARAILVDQAKTVCGYIADGDSPEDIVWIMTLAAEASGASSEIVDAFLAASVAATFTYCPQYEGFWE